MSNKVSFSENPKDQFINHHLEEELQQVQQQRDSSSSASSNTIATRRPFSGPSWMPNNRSYKTFNTARNFDHIDCYEKWYAEFDSRNPIEQWEQEEEEYQRQQQEEHRKQSLDSQQLAHFQSSNQFSVPPAQSLLGPVPQALPPRSFFGPVPLQLQSQNQFQPQQSIPPLPFHQFWHQKGNGWTQNQVFPLSTQFRSRDLEYVPQVNHQYLYLHPHTMPQQHVPVFNVHHMPPYIQSKIIQMEQQRRQEILQELQNQMAMKQFLQLQQAGQQQAAREHHNQGMQVSLPVGPPTGFLQMPPLFIQNLAMRATESEPAVYGNPNNNQMEGTMWKRF
uniref:Uncharacterized protein n=1 Tax=Caenorhabditis tropicalis TaxID=1561998 RepID=A0A1I7USF6_9PELO